MVMAPIDTAAAPAVKRVVSKDKLEGMREEKKSKMANGGNGFLADGDGGVAAGECLRQLALDDTGDPLALAEEDGAAGNAFPIPDVHVPVSHRSRAYSSLSDEGGANDDGATGNTLDEVVAACGGGMTRHASNDHSLMGRVSIGSEPSSNTDQRNSALWGWFEDVHGHEGGFLPDTSSSSANREGGDRAIGGGKKKKKGGLLHIGSELMHNVLHAIVEPQRHETNTMAVTAPTYVLEESLSSQKLWKQTAGNRPPQPVEERAFFEQVWAQNFARSKVKYEIPVEVLTASTPISISPFGDDGFGEDGGARLGNLSNINLAAPFAMQGDDGRPGVADPASVKAAQADVAEATLNRHLNSNGAVEMYFDPNRPKDYNLKTLGPHHHHHTLVNKKVKGAGEESDLTVLVRGDNVFGTTVSKSFPRVDETGQQVDGIDSVSISIASYRVVESKKHGKYAQYLVIFCDGNFRNTVGVWKRYSDFSQLSRKVTHGLESCAAESCAAVVTGLNPLSAAEDHDVEILPNAITSWRLLKKRQRWYRCLDAGYLSLKVFLLERFLHDILFESLNPQILRDFVGVNSSESSKLNTKG